MIREKKEKKKRKNPPSQPPSNRYMDIVKANGMTGLLYSSWFKIGRTNLFS